MFLLWNESWKLSPACQLLPHWPSCSGVHLRSSRPRVRFPLSPCGFFFQVMGIFFPGMGIFSRSSHTSGLEIGTPVATLPGAWHYRVSAETGGTFDWGPVTMKSPSHGHEEFQTLHIDLYTTSNRYGHIRTCRKQLYLHTSRMWAQPIAAKKDKHCKLYVVDVGTPMIMNSSSSVFPAVSLGFTILGEIFECVTVFFIQS